MDKKIFLVLVIGLFFLLSIESVYAMPDDLQINDIKFCDSKPTGNSCEEWYEECDEITTAKVNDYFYSIFYVYRDPRYEIWIDAWSKAFIYPYDPLDPSDLIADHHVGPALFDCASFFYIAYEPFVEPVKVTFHVEATYLTGYEAFQTKYIYVTGGEPPPNDLPVASFTASPQSGDAPLTVAFDGRGSNDPDGSITFFYWVFGDGGVKSGGSMPTHTYNSEGDYTVTLTVTDNGGATSSTQLPISVGTAPPANQAPVAGFTRDPSYGIAPLTVSFDASSSNDPDGSISSYSWNFGDGKTGSGITASNTYNSKGTFSVALTVTDDDGATASKTMTVVVQSPKVGTLLEKEEQTYQAAKETIEKQRDALAEITADAIIDMFSQSLSVLLDNKKFMKKLSEKMDVTQEELENYIEELQEDEDFQDLANQGEDVARSKLESAFKNLIDSKYYTQNRITRIENAHNDFVSFMNSNGHEYTDAELDKYILQLEDVLDAYEGAQVFYAGDNPVIKLPKIYINWIDINGVPKSIDSYTWVDKITSHPLFSIIFKLGGGDPTKELIIEVGIKPAIVATGYNSFRTEVEDITDSYSSAVNGVVYVIKKHQNIHVDIEEGWFVADVISFEAHSPVDLYLYKNGMLVDDAFYSGKDSEPELIMVSNPDGDYTLVIEGVEDGNFDLITGIWNGEHVSEIFYPTIHTTPNFRASISVDQAVVNYTMAVDYNNDNAVDEYIDPEGLHVIDKESPVEPPDVDIESPEKDDYSYTEVLDIVYSVAGDFVNVVVKIDDVIYDNLKIVMDSLSLGLHELAVSVSDSFGNIGTGFLIFNVIDDVPPVSTISLSGISGQNGWFVSDVEVTITAEDERSEIERIGYNFDGSSTYINYTTPFTISDEGIKTIYYRAVDTVGNEEAQKSQVLKIDKTWPTTTDNCSDDWINHDVLIILTPFDAVSGVWGTYPHILYPNGTVVTLDAVKIFFSEEGITQMNYYSKDYAGNQEAGSGRPINTCYIKIDKTLPEIVINIPKGVDYSYTTSFVVDFSATDSLSGINYTVAKIDGAEVNNNQTISLFNFGLGSHTFEVYTRDNAGNEKRESVTFNVIDNIPPLTTDNHDTDWHNSDITITLTSNDEKSDVKEIHYKVNNGTGQVVTLDADGASGDPFTVNVLITYEHDNNKIEYWAVDEWDNVENHVIVDGIKLDKTPPLVSAWLDPPKDYYSHLESLPVQYSAEDPVVQGTPSNSLSLVWDIDGNVVSDPTDVTNWLGTHTLTLKATDLAGNVNSSSLVFTVALELIGEDQLKITPESLKVNPGVLTVHLNFPQPYNESTITDATCDYASYDFIANHNVKFRRKDIEKALAERNETLDIHFEVEGEILYNSQNIIFFGSDDITKIQD